jgi:hypothetical protein
MFSSKQLSPNQINTIKLWAEQGARLADIQKNMREEMNLSLTYMDTRLVILDLGITLAEDKIETASSEAPLNILATGKTTVTVDSVTLPGAIISGRVSFSDGESAVWMLDQMGRPSIDPNNPNYQPTQDDIIEFQKQLRTLIVSAQQNPSIQD